MIQHSIIFCIMYFLGRSKMAFRVAKLSNYIQNKAVAYTLSSCWLILIFLVFIVNLLFAMFFFSGKKSGGSKAGLSFHPDRIRKWFLLFIFYLPSNLKTLFLSLFFSLWNRVVTSPTVLVHRHVTNLSKILKE